MEIGVGGGHGDLVAMHIFDGDETYYLRTSDDRSEMEYSLVSSGGSEIDVLTRWLVAADRAARALWFFLLTGDLDPGTAIRLSGGTRRRWSPSDLRAVGGSSQRGCRRADRE